MYPGTINNYSNEEIAFSRQQPLPESGEAQGRAKKQISLQKEEERQL
jgi:hypothetical protein